MAKRLLISGAGIAGPALAWALAGQGWDITVVERAPALRVGGHAVDFRGPVHREVLERLGLWEPIWAQRTPGLELVMLGGDGRPMTVLPAVMMSGDVEIVRGELTRLLVEGTAAHTRYRFGDHVVALNGTRVTFASGATEEFELVVGADGLHSGVRALAFGDESRFLRHHGYRLATWSMPNVLGLNQRAETFTVPGRSVMVSGHGTQGRAQLVYAGEPLGRDRFELDAMRAHLKEVYRDVGWEVPAVLATLDAATDLYFDQIGTVRLESFVKERVALLGDAAWGGTLGGQGTPLAIVGAYVLAGELRSTNDDVPRALQQFEQRMRHYARTCQQGAERAGSFFAPRTAFGLFCRNVFYRAFTSRLLIGQFEKMVKASAGEFEVPAYAA